MKERNISRGDIRKILNGDFDPLPFSEKRFKGKLEELEEMNIEWNKKHPNNKRILNRDSFYPKYELKDILLDLKYQRLDEEFFYDKIQKPTIQMKEPTSMMVPEKTTALAQNIQTPPLPQTPMPDQKLVASMPQINPQTGLTPTEAALLSPSEQEIARRT